MGSKIEFCTLKSNDAKDIFNLHMDFLISLSDICKSYYSVPLDKNSEFSFFSNKLSNDRSYCVCAKKEGNIVGYLLAYSCMTGEPEHYVKRNYAFIDEIYVCPTFRNKSIATHMISLAKKHFKEKGYKSMELFVVLENAASIGLYNKVGFNPMNMRMECIL